jgi:hypothetical protein
MVNNAMERIMSMGPEFLKFVEELKTVCFPVEAVSGGDIHRVWMKNLSIRDAIFELHKVAENKRRAKMLNKIN